MLHIICGECGSLLSQDNDDNEKARASYQESDKYTFKDIIITCENCGEEHRLSEYMEILW